MTATTHQSTANRRTFMQTVGAASAVAIAGCLAEEPQTGAESNESAEAAEPEREGLPAAESVDADVSRQIR